MKAKKLFSLLAAVTVTVVLLGNESYAQGKGLVMSSSKGQGNKMRIHSQIQNNTNSATQIKPEGSQRRDGSFLITGTTANGSTTRPEKGHGLRDGSGINHPRNSAQ